MCTFVQTCLYTVVSNTGSGTDRSFVQAFDARKPAWRAHCERPVFIASDKIEIYFIGTIYLRYVSTVRKVSFGPIMRHFLVCSAGQCLAP